MEERILELEETLASLLERFNKFAAGYENDIDINPALVGDLAMRKAILIEDKSFINRKRRLGDK